MGDWPSSRARAPAFPWDVQPRAAARRGAPDLSDDDGAATAAKPTATATALVPVQLGVGAFRAPIPRVTLTSAVRVRARTAPGFLVGSCLSHLRLPLLTPAPRAPQAPSVGFGLGGAQWGAGAPACKGEAAEGGSRLTARSVFAFPSSASLSVASASVTQSCAAFGAGDDGAEVTSGAAHAAAQHAAFELDAAAAAQPLPLRRGPPGFFAQLGAPPGLEMYYSGTAAPRHEQMAADAAALVPCAPSRKRRAPADWAAAEQPARVIRSSYDTASADHMDVAFDLVRRRASPRPARPLIRAPRAERLTEIAHFGRERSRASAPRW